MNILDCYEKKCQNLNYQCKYREGESCNCSHDAIVNIYENLIEKIYLKDQQTDFITFINGSYL